MIIETFKDIFSTIDYGIIDNKNGIEKLEKVRYYTLKNILDKILIYHITIHVNTMIENLFHKSNERLREDVLNYENYYDIGIMIDMRIDLMKTNMYSQSLSCILLSKSIRYLINGCKSKRILQKN